MKVRWSAGSLRLRITPAELEAVGRGAAAREEIIFPGGLVWRVTLRAGEATALRSDAGGVTVSLSAADRANLALPEAEGVYFKTPDGTRYYVEKDFPCAHPRAAEALEPITETFEAPPDFDQRKREM